MITETKQSQTATTPTMALDFLKAGNQRFTSSLAADRNLLKQVQETGKGQYPFAVVVSCIDSRVPVETVLDQGIGDIFSIRIAGNFINTDILGSIEFACKLAGAKLIVTDINQETMAKAAKAFNATIVGLDEIYDQDADIYAPCALGATINDQTINRLRVKVVAGCANNQLETQNHGQALLDRGILYAPDYVINAGGIINISFEDNYCANEATTKVKEIYQTLLNVYNKAKALNKPTNIIADEMARKIIENGGK